MPKIMNQFYQEFKEGKIIQVFTRELLQATLDNISYLYSEGKFKVDHSRAARAFIIVLWASGARPTEALNLIAGDIKKNDSNEIVIQFKKTLKGGNPRSLTLNLKDKYVKEFWEYASSIPIPEMFLFHAFRSKRVRTDVKVYKTRKNKITGEKEQYLYKDYAGKEYDIVSDKIWYYFQKWIKGVMDTPDGRALFPYYFRHSRLTVIADTEGNTIEDVRLFKGAKSYTSCTPYMQLTPRRAKKLGEEALK